MFIYTGRSEFHVTKLLKNNISDCFRISLLGLFGFNWNNNKILRESFEQNHNKEKYDKNVKYANKTIINYDS